MKNFKYLLLLLVFVGCSCPNENRITKLEIEKMDKNITIITPIRELINAVDSKFNVHSRLFHGIDFEKTILEEVLEMN